MANAADLSLDRRGSLLIPFALSVLLHALFVLLFFVRALLSPAAPSSPFEVELLQPQDRASAKAQAQPQANAPEKAPPAPAEEPVPPPKNQIVSPPDSPEQTPEQAHLFSDRDSKAIEEMIKRGEPAPPARPPQQP
ncbi:MAG TPA: hypothetical protein VLF14_03710, partial [Candidatus Binatia bacterium]|nr:hypothetical protein [Candidatus Binatia bacterium]